MILSPEQDKGLILINQWLRDSSRWMFYLGGYAGTGKTTMIQHMINGMNEKPLCLAPTGKAATVLQRKLNNCRVSTVHSALYKPLQQDTSFLASLVAMAQDALDKGNMEDYQTFSNQAREERIRLAKERPEFYLNGDASILPGSFVIIDEASMVSNRMLEDLENTEAKVLFVGDPGQLPPVKDKGYFSNNQPDYTLTTVQRQALDNPIIRLSMAIRNGEWIEPEINMPEIQRYHKAKFDLGRLFEFDQAMTGSNAQRRKVNRMMRKRKYNDDGGDHIWIPQKGDKLICLKNQYKFGAWFINGIQCETLSEAYFDGTEGMVWKVNLLYEGDTLIGVPYYPYHTEVHYNNDAEQEPYEHRRDLIELDYGYCITVHKAQGSEWNRVLLIDDEMNMWRQDERRKWLYTAVTRAKEHITWLREK